MQLLVSVSTAGEAQAALAGGADVIDAKDPGRGALGAVTPRRLEAIRAAVGGRRPISAALGDITDSGALRRAAHPARADLAYVKIGFRGLAAGALPACAASARRATRANLILVANADWRRAGSPSPPLVLEAAAAVGAQGILLDTAFKDATLLDLVPVTTLQWWIDAARQAGLRVALAGGLAGEDFRTLDALGADLVGVRGAACDGGREGRVSAARVMALSAFLRRTPANGRRVLI